MISRDVGRINRVSHVFWGWKDSIFEIIYGMDTRQKYFRISRKEKVPGWIRLLSSFLHPAYSFTGVIFKTIQAVGIISTLKMSHIQ